MQCCLVSLECETPCRAVHEQGAVTETAALRRRDKRTFAIPQVARLSPACKGLYTMSCANESNNRFPPDWAIKVARFRQLLQALSDAELDLLQHELIAAHLSRIRLCEDELRRRAEARP
jgi:hypothetical protein